MNDTIMNHARSPRLRARMFAPILLGALLTLGACGDESVDIVTPRPDSTHTAGTSGVSLYRYYCSACHGLNGQPLVTSSQDLRDTVFSFEGFDSVLTVGPGIMPQYPELDSAERRRIYDHVHTFRR